MHRGHFTPGWHPAYSYPAASLGPSRLEIAEEKKFMSNTVTFFKAVTKRAQTIGPGAKLHEDDQEDSNSSTDQVVTRGRTRRLSADHGHFHRPLADRSPSPQQAAMTGYSFPSRSTHSRPASRPAAEAHFPGQLPMESQFIH